MNKYWHFFNPKSVLFFISGFITLSFLFIANGNDELLFIGLISTTLLVSGGLEGIARIRNAQHDECVKCQYVNLKKPVHHNGKTYCQECFKEEYSY